MKFSSIFLTAFLFLKRIYIKLQMVLISREINKEKIERKLKKIHKK